MTIKKLFLLVILLNIAFITLGQTTISSGRISITMANSGNGIRITHIKDNGTELLDTNANSSIFTLQITDLNTNSLQTISASTAWGNVNINSTGSSCEIVFQNPLNTNLPNTLTAKLYINTNDEKSSWDLGVTGLGSYASLEDIIFPQINILAQGNDNFLYPLYSGRITKNPGSGIDYYDDASDPYDDRVGIYTRGWGTTMQFFSYYNANYGIYFGFHDSGASLKIFGVKNENGGIKIQCTTPAANKSVAANDWNMPGHFELDLFNGDWYDAALIYKEWVSDSAKYWPANTPEHIARQHNIGDIGVWLSSYISDTSSMSVMQGYIQTSLNFFDFPVGVHIYKWNEYEYDHFYPNYFPERNGLDTLIANIQNNNDAVIMPYINGRLWDTGIGGNDPGDSAAAIYFNSSGLADAAKQSNGSYYYSTFSSNKFATMCAAQPDWQDLMTEVAFHLTDSGRLGAHSIYIDMVGAASAAQCMDTTHNHSLGGGSFWSDGYRQMLKKIHDSIPYGDFITVEGGCDYLADQVDAFMVQGWQTDNQVPAWQAIYTGKVQLFGTLTGASMYGDQRFYGRLSQAFTYGVQTGRQFIWLAINPSQTTDKLMAANYVKSLGRLRYKLRDFMSYGEMKRPIKVNGTIPDISYTVRDWGGCRCTHTITNPAIRSTVWQSDTSVIVLFANGRIQSQPGVPGGNINFTFDFNPADYGLKGALTIQRITPTLDDTIISIINAPFQKSVSLANLDLVAYKIVGESGVYIKTSKNDKLNHIEIFPNPSHEFFTIKHNRKIEQVQIFNGLGQLVLTTNANNNVVDIRKLSKGIYVVVIKDDKAQYMSKLIKE